MIDATTIEEIKIKISERRSGGKIALVLFCRYRKDASSLAWRVAANNINYHYRSGEELDIYVPGFSFYGRSRAPELGLAIKIDNSQPLGYYYPKVLVDAENFFRTEMLGFQLGSSVVAVAIEVQDGAPDWKNGAVMNLSNRSAEDAERQIMSIIDGCKNIPGIIDPSTAMFRRNFRLSSLVGYLTRNGWSVASAFSGAGALILN